VDDRRQNIGFLSAATVMHAFALTHTPKLVPQGRQAVLIESARQMVHDLVVHRAAECRMRMRQDCQRRKRVSLKGDRTGKSGLCGSEPTDTYLHFFDGGHGATSGRCSGSQDRLRRTTLPTVEHDAGA
jgi:hypothetical protein